MGKSPLTSYAAIGIIVTVVGSIIQSLGDGDPSTNPQWATVLPALIGAIGFFFSRDQRSHDKGE